MKIFNRVGTGWKLLFIIFIFALFIFTYFYKDKIIGQIPIAYNYYQPINSKYIIETGQSSRIIPHRVNSIGKLNDIWKEGFRSFECDVRFGDNNTTKFRMGHDKELMGPDFETLLLSQDYTKIKKIWLDFKNLNVTNHKKALETLNQLDKKYNLKNKLIVESRTKDIFFKEFRDNGYHTCYYTPTSLIKKLLKENNKKEMNILAEQIAKQIKIQNTSAVSFYHVVYPFIKTYLEPKISKNVVYQIWFAPALYDSDFRDKLSKNKLYLDKRVKTLLSTYRSKFNI